MHQRKVKRSVPVENQATVPLAAHYYVTLFEGMRVKTRAVATACFALDLNNRELFERLWEVEEWANRARCNLPQHDDQNQIDFKEEALRQLTRGSHKIEENKRRKVDLSEAVQDLDRHVVKTMSLLGHRFAVKIARYCWMNLVHARVASDRPASSMWRRFHREVAEEVTISERLAYSKAYLTSLYGKFASPRGQS